MYQMYTVTDNKNIIILNGDRHSIYGRSSKMSFTKW